ncbi:MAG: XrtA-associated ATPase [Kiloniellales bacterium]|nr:XrtA-associated ATPase [Kiloniellales bacterium]
MYEQFFHLEGLPFQITPDARFFFNAGPHRKALAYATYGLSKGEGFLVITGEVGAGKTTLVDYLLGTLHQQRFLVGKVVTTQLEAAPLLVMIASAFGVPLNGHGASDKGSLISRLEQFFVDNYKKGERTLLIVDEAQNLEPGALEELRMLSNFQCGSAPVIQIFLLGQPEFRRVLAVPSLDQLRQRVIAYYHLTALEREETQDYILHRLRQVGWRDDPKFAPESLALIHDETAGIPRRINLLCDRILLYCYLEEKHLVAPDDVRTVIDDMREEDLTPRPTDLQPSFQQQQVVQQYADRSSAPAVQPRANGHLDAGQGRLSHDVSGDASLRDLVDRVSELEVKLSRIGEGLEGSREKAQRSNGDG